MSSCSHACAGCSQTGCGRRNMHEQLHEKSSVKKIIGIVSGKGGVGKSLVTALLASAVARSGRRVAVLDADITGPSMPKVFGRAEERAEGDGSVIYPIISESGIQIMSMNFLLPSQTDPAVWRGPIIAGAVKQFWTDVIWDNVDFMFIDMPPGTGDVPLTVFQSLPLDGIIIVSSPQELVNLIVEKAVKMSSMMQVPVLGLIENMSYLRCPCCDTEIKVFGNSNIEKIAAEYSIPVLARIPIDPKIAAACDEGKIEQYDASPFMDYAASAVGSLLLSQTVA